jgi:putative ABC transport system permease protein
MSDFAGDCIRAARGLRRTPGLLAFATVALALGIAAPTVMFSIAHGMLRELPVPDGHRLVHIAAVEPRVSDRWLNLRPHDVLAVRAQQQTLTGVAAFGFGHHDVAAPGERPERRHGAIITADAFRVLGVAPALGRDFTAEDAVPGAAPVVIISDALWRARFAGAPDVLGGTLRIDGVNAAIIGVMPPGFEFPNIQQLWTPLRLDAAAAPTRAGWQYVTFGRLPPGTSLDAAKADLAAVAHRLERELPDTNQQVSYVARPYREQLLARDLRRILAVMVLLVSCVLLVAAANVANLLVARAVGRSREVAVRAALGATRGRIMGEHLLEAAVIAVAGGALGLLLSRAGIAAFTTAVAHELPYWATFRLELPVLLFAALCISTAALVAGTVPALQASGVDVNDTLKEESRGASSFRVGRLSRALVVAQIAFSCALLIISGLMIRGVMDMSRVEGYAPERVLTARLELRPYEYELERVPLLYRALLDRLHASAGVNAAALTHNAPGLGMGSRLLEIEDGADRAGPDPTPVRTTMISPGYFAAAGTALLRGRDFTWSDDAAAAPAAIISQPFVERYYPTVDPIGRRVRLARGAPDPGPWATIVGVAPDFGAGRADEGSAAVIYFPLAQHPFRSIAVMLHTDGDPLALMPALRSALRDVGADVPLFDTGRLDRVIADTRTVERVFGILFGLFGAAALLLAAIGLYGTMAFGVSRRTRELGIRSALGARPAQLVWVPLRGGMLQVAIGAALGVGIALLLAPLFGDALFGTSARDPSVYAAVTVTLVLTGIAAAALPALRAARLEPTTALREE